MRVVLKIFLGNIRKLFQKIADHKFGLLVVLILIPLTTSLIFHFVDRLPSGPQVKKIGTAFENSTLTVDNYTNIDLLGRQKLKLGVVDNFSECVSLGQLFNQSAIPFGYHNTDSSWSLSPCIALKNAARSGIQPGGSLYQSPYFRFWHGGAFLSKLSLYLLSYLALKIFLVFLIIGMLLLITLRFGIRNRISGGLFFIYFFMLSDLFLEGFSPVHAWSTAVGILPLTLMSISKKPGWYSKFLPIFFFGFEYGVFSQLFMPILFAILYTISAIFFSNERKLTTFNFIKIPFFWISGFIYAVVFRALQSLTKISMNQVNAEFTNASANKFIESVTELCRVIYMHTYVSTTAYPLRFFGVMFLFIISGYLLQNCDFGFVLNFQMIFPALLLILWFSVFAHASGHGWSSDITYLVLVYVIFIANFSKHNMDKFINRDRDEF